MEEIEIILNAVREMLAKKNADYGAAAEKKPLFFNGELSPLSALYIRLNDKIKRLDNLRALKLAQKTPLIKESLQDTILDLIGYSVLILKEEKKENA